MKAVLELNENVALHIACVGVVAVQWKPVPDDVLTRKKERENRDLGTEAADGDIVFRTSDEDVDVDSQDGCEDPGAVVVRQHECLVKIRGATSFLQRDDARHLKRAIRTNAQFRLRLELMVGHCVMLQLLDPANSHEQRIPLEVQWQTGTRRGDHRVRRGSLSSTTVQRRCADFDLQGGVVKRGRGVGGTSSPAPLEHQRR